MARDETEITAELLLHAYASGVFPMSEARDDPDIFWVDPKRRGVFPMDGFRTSRSLRKRALRGGYAVTLNRDFAGVVAGCADRPDTWINTPIRRLYQELHDHGHAHSLEIRDAAQGRLIGGVYGVALGAAFFGESMFSRQRDASKLALLWLMDHLRRCGFRLFDTQFLTPHLASLGAEELPRARYRAQLAEALAAPADIMAVPLAGSAQAVLQRMTQTS